MKQKYKFIALIVIVVSAISSCELYNPAEPIPSYIHIDRINLSTAADGSQGSNSSKISDAWIYVDEQLVGCFELPSTVPIIADGIHTIRIRPGIKVNGIASTRAPYPFFNDFNQSVTLQKGKVVTINPTTTYLSTTIFSLLENFESPGVKIDTTHISNTPLHIINSPDPNVFEGHSSAMAKADPVNSFFECATVTKYELPTAGAAVFLEFNYKSNYEFTVSIFAYGSSITDQFPVLHFNPSPIWNKAYVYMTPSVSGASSAINYTVSWGMVDNTGKDSAIFYLDNIKLIHF